MRVAIVGGGLSGTLTAIQLLQQSFPSKLRLVLVNTSATFGRGLAYGTEDDNLLLNVPAGNMSAFAEEPSHFVAYCQTIDPAITARSFVSRRLYGDYLQHALSNALVDYPDALELRVDEAISVTRPTTVSGGNSMPLQVNMASGKHLTADHVVLALGHQGPQFPLDIGAAELEHVISPWDFGGMHKLAPEAPVVILGTGHTAIDALFTLTQSQQIRPIWLISRHGLLPQGHRLNPQPPAPHDFPTFLRNVPATVANFTRSIRQEIAQQKINGVDWRDVMNALRPYTPQLWQSLSTDEKRRFLQRLVPYWDIHRHRLAPIAEHRLKTILRNGRVKVMDASLAQIQKQDSNLQIRLFSRARRDNVETIHASALINCTGPNTKVATYSNRLFKQLVSDGLLQPDPHALGIQINDCYQPIDAQGQFQPGLWYLGPLLKAKYWESVAAPELRIHAQRLAKTLLSEAFT